MEISAYLELNHNFMNYKIQLRKVHCTKVVISSQWREQFYENILNFVNWRTRKIIYVTDIVCMVEYPPPVCLSFF